jgi:hypothetical protein
VRGETVAVNAGGDVTVRSMVDVDTMEHTNQSATVGTGTLGGSMGYATHRSERVGTVSSITGETVVLEADSVDVVGGVIAATDATGADTGELTLRANRLTVSDVELKTESERLQLGGRTVGSGASVPAGESHATGQTTVSLGYGKYDRLDRVNGTIGNGTVEAGNADALDDVNRDVTQVRETVSETDGGSFDASLTVDHRVFSQTGRSEMGNELKELPGNIRTSGHFLHDYREHKNAEGLAQMGVDVENFNDAEMTERKMTEKYGFILETKERSKLHGKGNQKWVGKTNGVELVTKKNEAGHLEIVKNNSTKGTWNFCKNNVCHGVADVVPWFFYGASKEDESNILDRTLLIFE